MAALAKPQTTQYLDCLLERAKGGFSGSYKKKGREALKSNSTTNKMKKLLLILVSCTMASNIGLAQKTNWWIEKNTPIALNVEAARHLQVLIHMLIKDRIDIKSGEDWHDILAAAFEEGCGKGYVDENLYVTKRKSFIYLVYEEIPDFDSEPLEVLNSMTPFRVLNNPTIYFVNEYFVESPQGSKIVVPGFD